MPIGISAASVRLLARKIHGVIGKLPLRTSSMVCRPVATFAAMPSPIRTIWAMSHTTTALMSSSNGFHQRTPGTR